MYSDIASPKSCERLLLHKILTAILGKYTYSLLFNRVREAEKEVVVFDSANSLSTIFRQQFIS